MVIINNLREKGRHHHFLFLSVCLKYVSSNIRSNVCLISFLYTSPSLLRWMITKKKRRRRKNLLSISIELIEIDNYYNFNKKKFCLLWFSEANILFEMNTFASSVSPSLSWLFKYNNTFRWTVPYWWIEKKKKLNINAYTYRSFF